MKVKERRTSRRGRSREAESGEIRGLGEEVLGQGEERKQDLRRKGERNEAGRGWTANFRFRQKKNGK